MNLRLQTFAANTYQQLHTSRFIPLCLIAALVIRLAWIIVMNTVPTPYLDSHWYYVRAADLARGQGYHVDGVPTAYWPVGYPAFLGVLFAIFGVSAWVGKVANVLLVLGILLLAYHLTRRLFLSEVQARLTLLLLAFYPNTIVYTSLLMSEILFTFLLLLVVALLLRTDDGLLAKIATGLVAACLCLVKPQAIVLPLLVMVAAFVWPAGRRNARDMLSKLLIVYLCAGLLITLWTIRNVQVFDAVIFISNNGGVNLRIGNNPQADGTFADWTEEMKTTARKQAGEYEIDQAFRQAALEYIRQHPWRTLQLLPAKVYHLYRDEQTGIHWNRVELRPATSGVYTALHIFQVVTNIYYWLIGVLFLASIVFLIRRRQPFPLEGLAIIGYFTLLAMVFFGDSRYHFPLIPWLVMYASAPLAAGLASATPPPPAAETAHPDTVAPRA